jgi:hypothetical protein
VVPAAALLVRRAEGWLVATSTSWRPANREIGAELDRAIADPAFWTEAAYTPPCPDFGASLILLKVPGKVETVRYSTCISRASRMAEVGATHIKPLPTLAHLPMFASGREQAAALAQLLLSRRAASGPERGATPARKPCP